MAALFPQHARTLARQFKIMEDAEGIPGKDHDRGRAVLGDETCSML